MPLWRETYKLSIKLSMQNAEKIFTQFAFFMLLFFLINSAEITKASLFGLEFKSLSLPYIFLFFLSSLNFYRFSSVLCFAQVVEEAIRKTYVKLFKDFQYSGLTDLASYPSIPQIENCFSNLEDDKDSFFQKYVGSSFLAFRYSILSLIILALFGSASYCLWRSTLVNHLWAIPLICISWILILRSYILFIQVHRHTDYSLLSFLHKRSTIL